MKEIYETPLLETVILSVEQCMTNTSNEDGTAESMTPGIIPWP